MTAVIFGDRSGGELGQGREQVDAVVAHGLRPIAQDAAQEGFAEPFASGALGRCLAEERMTEPVVEARRVDVAGRGPSAVPVEGIPVIGDEAGGEVEEDVGGAGIEGKDVGWLIG